MQHAAGTGEENGPDRGPFSAEFKTAVKTEVEAMLTTPIFVQSGRCKRFLSYIVDQTLAGNANQLKERTIGINVFERANDYDTGDDSIVRVTANEVRKRISQFYRESPQPRLVQIDLPRGSYVPEFRIQPPRRVEKPIDGLASDHVEVESGPIADSITESRAAHQSRDAETTPAPNPITNVKASRHSNPRRLVYSVLLILIAVSIVLFWDSKVRSSSRVPDLWDAFLHSNVPILVCIDTHDLQPLVPQPPTDGQRFVDLVLRRQAISLDDAAILSSMASQLGKKGIPFRVVGAEQTSLADLRRQPVILIGAIDNKWTLRLTQNLRYRVEVANPPGPGSRKEPIASILDSEHPADTQWVADLSVPFAAWKADYAIVARMDDSTTGVPVMIEAGLGNNGTVAASEIISSGAMATVLSSEPSCRDKHNFEAVIGTQIIEMKSGPPHVLRLTCW